MIARWLRRNLPSLVLFGALLVAWQLAVSVFRVREYILPGPITVLRATLDFRIPWWTHL
jgi:NitT/TauT family transport system permease protein